MIAGFWILALGPLAAVLPFLLARTAVDAFSSVTRVLAAYADIERRMAVYEATRLFYVIGQVTDPATRADAIGELGAALNRGIRWGRVLSMTRLHMAGRQDHRRISA